MAVFDYSLSLLFGLNHIVVLLVSDEECSSFFS